MYRPGRGSTTCFQRDERMRRGSAIDSTNGAALGPRYCRGAHSQANARRRLKASWLRDIRIELAPGRRIARTATSRKRELARSLRKYSARRIGGGVRGMALNRAARLSSDGAILAQAI